MLKVIAVTGPKRSGKNTTATLLKALSDEEFLQIQLADPIKDGFDRISGPGRELHKDLDENGWTNRRAWQTAGTEARDLAGDPLVWCRVALTWVCYLSRLHPRKYDRFVIPDLRFPHEEAFLREHIARLGGEFELWRIASNRFKSDQNRVEHISETLYGQLTPDRLILNTGTRRGLADLVQQILEPNDIPQQRKAS